MTVLKKILTVFSLGILLMSFTIIKPNKIGGNEDPKELLKNFPEAEAGMQRFVIFLDKIPNEENYKIELIPGRIVQVDCNSYTLTGSLEERVLDGWGYIFYRFNSNGNTISTRMLCPDNKVENKFISGVSAFINYNSKLPIVIYAPKGFEIKYKIYKAKEQKVAPVK